jgi:protein-tyrosine phosphatase
MRAKVYWIPGSWRGKLGIVLRPRGGDWLEDEVRSWRDAGLNVIVSSLTPEETAEFELGQEEAHCRAQGILFRSFPIPDRGLPMSREAVLALVEGLEQSLEAGKSVAVHCRQGIGRSALLVSALLVSAGVVPAQALQTVEKARGCPVPDTPEQSQWVADFASALSSLTREHRG